MTNPTRFSKQEDLAVVRHELQRYESLSSLDQTHERLRRLRTFIRELADTEQGRKELRQRTVLLGACHPAADETPSVFYGRLRVWLDKDLSGHVLRMRCEASANHQRETAVDELSHFLNGKK